MSFLYNLASFKTGSRSSLSEYYLYFAANIDFCREIGSLSLVHSIIVYICITCSNAVCCLPFHDFLGKHSYELSPASYPQINFFFLLLFFVVFLSWRIFFFFLNESVPNCPGLSIEV